MLSTPWNHARSATISSSSARLRRRDQRRATRYRHLNAKPSSAFWSAQGMGPGNSRDLR